MIHSTAIVDIELDPTSNVWAYAHVLSGARIGKRVNIGDHAFVEGGASIGDNCTIKNYVCIWNGVSVEADVFVGPRVTFTNDKNPRSPRMPSAQARYETVTNWLETTLVRKGCSIGAAATICPGIELGRYSMVAAGAVVTRHVADFALVAGVPAVQIGWVCSCGQRLSDRFDIAICSHCGETPSDREAKANISD